MKKILYGLLAMASVGAFADSGSIWAYGSYNYGVNVLDNATIPANTYVLHALYQFESSPLIIGLRGSFNDGDSDRYYAVTNTGVTSWTKSVDAPSLGFEIGASIPVGKIMRNNMLAYVQNTIGANYSINCDGASNPAVCHTQQNKPLNTLGIGLENDFMFELYHGLVAGVVSGMMFNFSSISNYTNNAAIPLANTQSNHSVLPYFGLSAGYKFDL